MNLLQKIYQTLLNMHGSQGWWPIAGNYSGKTILSESDLFEICVGAILTQNTSWNNVEKALEQLRNSHLLTLKKIACLPEEKLQSLIKSSGYFRQKAKKLRLFAQHVIAQHGSCKHLLSQPLLVLRSELLSLWGIGPETADSIILYASQKPVFVIDAYTKRICTGLGLCKPNISYDELQHFFMTRLFHDTQLFKEYHSLIVQHAKVCCKKNMPEKCVLRNIEDFD